MRSHWKAVLPLLALGSLAGCGASPAPQPAPAEKRSSRSPWVEAKAPEGIALLTAPARALPTPEGEASLTAPFPARIVSVRVQPGDRVEKGAPLVEVVMPEIVSAAGRLAAASEKLAALGKRHGALEEMKAHGLVRMAEIADVEAAMGEARAERLTARAILASAGLSERDGTSLLSGTGAIALRSPTAGVVVSVDAPLGAVREAAGGPLVRVAGEASTRLVARFPVTPPAGATFTFAPLDGSPVPVEAVSTSPIVDGRDGSREIFFRPQGPVVSGATGTLKVDLPEGGAVAVPARSLRLVEGIPTIYLREGEGEKPVSVVVLASTGAQALIRGDVRPGDLVAADASTFAPIPEDSH